MGRIVLAIMEGPCTHVKCLAFAAKFDKFSLRYRKKPIYSGYFLNSILSEYDGLCETVKNTSDIPGTLHCLVDKISFDLLEVIGNRQVMIKRNELIDIIDKIEFMLSKNTIYCSKCKKIVTKGNTCHY